MSNHLAVATVTATLRRLLQAAVSQDVPGATVSTSRLETMSGALPTTGVNIFLYQVMPNPDWRNRDLPTRRADGSLVELPEAAVDLHYLLSFHGEDADLEAQRLMASSIRMLHARPLLSREAIEDTLADPAFSFLAGSDLAEQVDNVRLVPLGLTLDELSQLWSGIFSTIEYHLSVAYRASVVLLTAAEESPRPALPVRRRQFGVFPFRRPEIEAVLDAADPAAPVTVGSTVEITGERLRAASGSTLVRLGGVDFAPADAGEKAVRFLLDAPVLDPADLRAGVQAVQVIHPDRGEESNVAPLILRPRLDVVTAANFGAEPGGTVAGDVTAGATPPFGERQRVNLLLNSLPGVAPAQSYSFAAPARASDLSSLVFAVSGVVPGTYLARLQVDGAESVLVSDADPASPTFEQYTAPTVALETP